MESISPDHRDHRDKEQLCPFRRISGETVEEESRAKHHFPAPWYFTQLCIVYRKLKDYPREVDTAGRYLALLAEGGWGEAVGAVEMFTSRRDKARALLAKGLVLAVSHRGLIDL